MQVQVITGDVYGRSPGMSFVGQLGDVIASAFAHAFREALTRNFILAAAQVRALRAYRELLGHGVVDSIERARLMSTLTLQEEDVVEARLRLVQLGDRIAKARATR